MADNPFMEPDPIRLPFEDVPYHLRGYRAQLQREHSNDKRHVYYSGPMKMYITIRRAGDGLAEMEFTRSCPCDGET
jgi:hypothetical protein